ncbi:MAG: hypothetical protein JSW04_08935 [Desulfobacterales bacterium]|nr:MAG: hypothetical protein JSV38_05455 [Desulfobacterales bacterium]UCD88589.1 MAG: hypothetical protein JSW04_08935 [Desulfobacterales bacterium]
MKPSVSKYWLIALAGVTWSTVGIMLCRLAYQWLSAVQWEWSLPLGLIGIVLAWVAYRLGFSVIADKNIDRICLLADRSCLFAFQAWKSYIIIIIMILLGIFLRQSPLPKYCIAIVYMTMGGALFFSSLHYYHRIWAVKIQKRSCLPLDEL